MELCFVQSKQAGCLRRCRVCDCCANVAEDSRVHAAGEAARAADIGERTNPVVGSLLISHKDERVTLPRVDLNRVNDQRLNILPVYLDYGLYHRNYISIGKIFRKHIRTDHGMIIDRERIVGVARHGDEAEPVALV